MTSLDANLPPPLLPPEVDLRGMPFMPLDVARLLDSDLFALSSGDEFKAAVALWCKSWTQVPAASLPDDDRVLAHLSGAGARWRSVRPMAMRGWILCADGRWYHSVIADKAREAWAHRLAQRERARKRWSTVERRCSSPVPDAAAYAAACPTASPAAMQGTGTGTGTVTEKSTEGGKPPPTPARFALPDWIPADAWSAYEESRRRMRKPMTARARELAIAKLDEIRGKGHDVRAVIEASVLNGWTGLFEPKPARGATRRPAPAALGMVRHTEGPAVIAMRDLPEAMSTIDYRRGIGPNGEF